MNTDIEVYVQKCSPCNLMAHKKREFPLMYWEKSSYPFGRIHLDHFFFESKMYLVIIDSFSNWLHVEENKVENSQCVILSLRKFCAIFGLPKVIVSDNKTPFVSKQFKDFLNSNAIIHKCSPEYHPQSNGLAEKYVGITKQNLKKYLIANQNSRLSFEEQLQNYLYKSHNTPLIDNLCPSDKIFNFKPRTLLSQCQRSMLEKNIQTSKNQQNTLMIQTEKLGKTKKRLDNGRRIIPFRVGDNVYVWWPRAKTNYIEGVIIEKISNLIFKIRLCNNHTGCPFSI